MGGEERGEDHLLILLASSDGSEEPYILFPLLLSFYKSVHYNFKNPLSLIRLPIRTAIKTSFVWLLLITIMIKT